VIVAEEDSDADPPGTQFTFDALAEPSSGGAPLDVEFSLALEDPPPNLTVSWDFGDGTPGSDLRNPSHRYRDAGEYTVVVRISAPGIDEDSREIGIEVTEEAFDVDIEADPDIGPAPLTTRFNAVVPEDLEPELTCSWDFGDGTSGSGRTTEHTYREPGTYSVKLAVTHSNQQRGTREIEVQVDPPDEDEEEAP
jgi:PKD repeat protein